MSPHLVASSLLLLAAPAAAQKSFLYAIENVNAPTRLVRMDADTGERLEIVHEAPVHMSGLTRRGNGLMSTDYSPDRLTSITPYTGVKSTAGPMPFANFRGLEASPVGGIYILVDSPNRLYRMDRGGVWNLAGHTPHTTHQMPGFAINSGGLGYAVSGGWTVPSFLWTLDVNTVAMAPVGPIAGLPSWSLISDLAFDENDVLHAAVRPTGAIYTINLNTAVATFKHDTGNYTSIAFHTSCGTVASSTNYGAGWAGTNGIPALTSSPPRVGTVIDVVVHPSQNVPTGGTLLVGLSSFNWITPWGGIILLNYFTDIPVSVNPIGGTAVPFPTPNDINLCGAELYFQSLQVDPGASHGVAFSPGLHVVLGS